MYSIVRNVCAIAIAAFVLGAPATPARARQHFAATFRDAFADGSGRFGPVMVRLNGGSFVMGAHPGDPEYRTSSIPHVVDLSAYAIAQFSVTGAQFAQFLNDRARTSAETDALVQRAALGVLRDRKTRPATGVTWYGALEYARWLSRKTGHPYALPSEAQWEFAARSGSESTWPWGSDWQQGRANCNHEHETPLPATALHPNTFGVTGMPGNVWEWTADCFDLDFYMHSPTHDPVFLRPSCAAPMIRGGSFADPPAYCSPGYRVNYFAQGSATEIGFRVVRRVAFARLARTASSVIERSPLAIGAPGGATLEIDVTGDRTDLPLALNAGVFTDVPQSVAEDASPPIADFLEQRRELPLSLGGVTRITGLPGTRLGIYVVAADVSISAKRMVTIPAHGIVRLQLRIADLIGSRRHSVLRGIVRTRAGGTPVANATIVYGCYPERIETRTDERGRFVIARVDENRNGTLLVDAPKPGSMPPFDRTTAIVPVTPALVRSRAHTPWEIDLLDIEKGERS